MVDSTRFNGGDDAIFFENTLFSQFANELVICGVTIDNQVAQSLGSCRTLEFSGNRTVPAVSHILCFCHAINLMFANLILDCPILRQVIESVNRWHVVFRTGLGRRIRTVVKRCPSIRKTRWLCAPDSFRWIGSHLREIGNVIMVYLEGDDEEIHLPRRNPLLDILAEGGDAE
jgi:hypothetical protein